MVGYMFFFVDYILYSECQKLMAESTNGNFLMVQRHYLTQSTRGGVVPGNKVVILPIPSGYLT